jgi:hypothetical protein
MGLLAWLRRPESDNTAKKYRDRGPAEPSRAGETIAIDVIQDGNSLAIEGDEIVVHFSVERMDLPLEIDPSFAVWALLAFAMEGGFNLHIKRPIDPVVAANAERLTRIWEMWVPSRYRSIKVSGEGEWSRKLRERLPRVQLYSGGCDSTYAILKGRDPVKRGYVATICGLDYGRNKGDSDAFAKLLAKTEPLLEALNYQRIIIRTDASRPPQRLTHAFTLASSLFLLSDLFAEGLLAADLTPPQDAVAFPWGSNHITNPYLAGSDFAVRTICAEVGRTAKLAAIASTQYLPFLACCRQSDSAPVNCGVCWKCVQTKAMLLAVTGSIPDIFRNRTLDERLMQNFRPDKYRAELFDLYRYAKDRGVVDIVPGLERLVEQRRAAPPANKAARKKQSAAEKEGKPLNDDD